MIANPFSRSVRMKDGLPVLPGALPFVGHLVQIGTGRDLTAILSEAREKLGPLFWVDFGMHFWTLFCAEPEGFETLKSRSSTTKHFQEIVEVLLGRSLLTQDGAPHHHMRTAMNGPFSPRGMIASAIGEVTASIIGARLAAWDARAVTILEETQAIALEIIFRVMGIRSEEMSAWRVKYQEFLLAGVPLTLDVPFSPRRRAKRARAWLDARLGAIVAATRNGQEKSLLRALIDARDERGEALTDEELLDNLRLLALAGHETTASTMAWVAITLARRPDLCEALVKEAGAAETIPRSPQEVRAYPLAEGLFREVVRLYPPVAFTSRRMTDWVTLCHHRIPPGTLVGVPFGVIGRHPRVHSDPMRFDPGRWMGRSAPPTPLETSSFGGGTHFCLGYHFAWMEVVQFAVAFARELVRRGVRPRLADGPAPVLEYSPLGHPTRRTRLEFVR